VLFFMFLFVQDGIVVKIFEWTKDFVSYFFLLPHPGLIKVLFIVKT